MKRIKDFKLYMNESRDFSFIIYGGKIGIMFLLIYFATNYFKPELRWELPFSSSITYSVAVIGIISIFIGVEYLRWKKWDSHSDETMFLRYYNGIITTMGIISGSFFIMITILWERADPLPRLRDHTWIGLGFLVFILLNGADLLLIIQKYVIELRKRKSRIRYNPRITIK